MSDKNERKAPYDEVFSNYKYLETIENTLVKNISRGKRFSFHPTAIVEVPEKELLRKNMQERYGIKNIDDYFLPVIVDTSTYWLLKDGKEPSLSELGIDKYLKESSCVKGSAYPMGGYYLAYISTTIPTDLAIEHEGLHAYVFKHSPEFKDFRSLSLSHIIKGPLSKEKEGWTEAISWVLTMDEFDIDGVFKNYHVDKLKISLTDRFRYLLLTPLAIGIDQAKILKTDFSSDDYKYVALNNLFLHLIGVNYLLTKNKSFIPHWRESFETVQKIKSQYSMHDAVEILGTKNRDEVVRMVR
ncbi:MAG: hypothetical protein KC535_02835 [Nanoarchaeota archaeon]|nr:hypothetical protein [Nanoarchaeota archaeon]